MCCVSQHGTGQCNIVACKHFLLPRCKLVFLAKIWRTSSSLDKEPFSPAKGWSARSLREREVCFFAAASVDKEHHSNALCQQDQRPGWPVQSAVYLTSRPAYGLLGCFQQHQHSSGLHISVCGAFSNTINHHTVCLPCFISDDNTAVVLCSRRPCFIMHTVSA